MICAIFRKENECLVMNYVYIYMDRERERERDRSLCQDDSWIPCFLDSIDGLIL